MRFQPMAVLPVLFAGLFVPSAAVQAQAPAPVKHVFLIMLENKNYSETFSPTTAAPYLAKTLPAQGAFLPNYYSIGHNSLINYQALISGQAPNLIAQTDCQIYLDFDGIAKDPLYPDNQAFGQGCVYPSGVTTVADQLTARSLTWHGYMEDMQTNCLHPVLNSPDYTQQARVGDQYAARHNPFVYFHSLINSSACAANDVPLTSLPNDLKAVATTPNFSFISPNLCDDGHDSPCLDGRPGGLAQINTFLEQWIPMILSSPAYKQDGLLIITFDEAEFESASSDSSSCCGEIPGPNAPLPGIAGLGGGRVGAVLLSPFIKPGTVVETSYNHYGLLRTVEDIFGLSHLGFAGQNDVAPFAHNVFTLVP